MLMSTVALLSPPATVTTFSLSLPFSYHPLMSCMRCSGFPGYSGVPASACAEIINTGASLFNRDALFKVPMLKSTPIAAVDDIPGFSGFNAGVIVYQVRKITL